MAAAVLTPTKPEVSTRIDRGGGSSDGFRGGGFGGGGRDDARDWPVPVRVYRTGMWMALVAIVMLFAAFTSAMVVRKGLSNDWVTTALPRVSYLNAAVLLISSLTLELSRRSLAAGFLERFVRWWYVTLVLGLVFVGGQLLAWRELAARGVYLASNPASSFFYLLTAAHGVHLLGGIAALFYIVLRGGRIIMAPRGHSVVDAGAIYWHFMDALWVYILILLAARF
jgi:cytochrome c oxidase subunit 3